ncbi:MAG: hypothetical protein IKX14_01995 [Neisseriaceae bacterium]|nr:hypothetical protein [Neisseriaceae bacterium]
MGLRPTITAETLSETPAKLLLKQKVNPAVGWATCCPRVFGVFRLPEMIKINAYRRCWWAGKPTLRRFFFKN